MPCKPSLADKAPGTNTYHSQTIEVSVGPSHASTQGTEPSGGSQAQNAIVDTYLLNPFSSKLHLVNRPGCHVQVQTNLNLFHLPLFLLGKILESRHQTR